MALVGRIAQKRKNTTIRTKKTNSVNVNRTATVAKPGIEACSICANGNYSLNAIKSKSSVIMGGKAKRLGVEAQARRRMGVGDWLGRSAPGGRQFSRG
jgi:hypothetical protein